MQELLADREKDIPAQERMNVAKQIKERYCYTCPDIVKEFGKYGSITSVKIMYPRTDEHRSRGSLSGFVQFQAREEAEQAKRELDGKQFHGMPIRIDWGTRILGQKNDNFSIFNSNFK